MNLQYREIIATINCSAIFQINSIQIKENMVTVYTTDSIVLENLSVSIDFQHS